VRTLVDGDLFSGAGRMTEARFCRRRLGRGAAGAGVDCRVGSRVFDAGANLSSSPDTLAALQDLSAWARLRWGGKVVWLHGRAGQGQDAKD